MTKNIDEIKWFVIAGFSAVATDLIIYYLLLDYFNINFSKLVSFLSGTFVSYLINKYYTFKKNEINKNEIFNFLILYTFTLLANIFVNGFVLSYFNHMFLAFLIATSISAVLNFLGQKFWVFK